MAAGLVSSGILFFIFLLLFSPIHIRFVLDFEQNRGNISVIVRAFFGLFRFCREKTFPSGDLADGENSFSLKDKKAADEGDERASRPVERDFTLERLRGIWEVLKGVLRKTAITRFRWFSELGVRDPAWTGIASGFGWALKGIVVGAIGQWMRWQTRPDLGIRLSFMEFRVTTFLECMFRIRLGQAILAAIKLFIFWKKLNKQEKVQQTMKDRRVMA